VREGGFGARRRGLNRFREKGEKGRRTSPLPSTLGVRGQMAKGTLRKEKESEAI